MGDKNKLLSLLQSDLETIDYLLDHEEYDNDDTYRGIRKGTWLTSFQAKYPKKDFTGSGESVTYYSLKDESQFLYSVRQEIIKQRDLLESTPEETVVAIPGSIPPNIVDLVQKWEQHKKVSKSETTAAQKALTDQWEIDRQSVLQKTIAESQNTQAKEIQKRTESILATHATRDSNVLQDPTKIETISEHISKKLKEEAEKNTTWVENKNAARADLSNLLSEILKETEISSLPQDLQNRIKDALLTGVVGDDLVKKIVSISSLSETNKYSKEYQEALKNKKSGGSPLDLQTTIVVQNRLARTLTANYVDSLVSEIRSDLARDFGLSPTEIYELEKRIIGYSLQHTLDSHDYSLASATQEEVEEKIRYGIKQAFSWQIRSLATPHPIRDTVSNAGRMLLGQEPTDKLKRANSILSKIERKIDNPPPEVTSSVTGAVFGKHSDYNASLAGGDPLGRIPDLIQLQMMGMASDPDKLDFFYDQLINSNINKPQAEALRSLRDFLKTVNSTNPALSKLLAGYARNRIPLAIGKISVSTLLFHPEYASQLPSYWFNTFWSLKKFQIKMGILRKISRSESVFLKPIQPFFKFWWKENPWGFYENPIERLKRKAQYFFIKKLLRGTGKFFIRLGRKVGLKFLKKIGLSIARFATSGPLGLIVTLFGDFIKRIGKTVGFALGLIIFWASNYGIFGLGGSLLGLIGGNILGVKLGILVFGATAPFLGPLAIIPAILTWAVTTITITFFGAWLGMQLAKLTGIGTFSGLGAQASSAGNAVTTAGLVNPAPALVGAISGIVGLTTITMIVTSSAFFTPEGDTNLIGSQYIEIKKSVDVAGIKNPDKIENSVIGIDQKVVYELEIKATGANLENIIVTDKNTITNERGSSEITNNERYVVNGLDANGKYIFGNNIPEKWDQTTDPELKKLSSGSLWKKTYGFKLEDLNRFKDSYISNTVVVVSNKEGSSEIETKTITLTFKIGNPPIPPLAITAQNLLSRLRACFVDFCQTNSGTCAITDPPRINKNNFSETCMKDPTKNPTGIIFNNNTVVELMYSVNTWDHLQCGSFVVATTIETNNPLAKIGNAKDYYGKNVGNYKWHNSSEFDKIQTGDIFVSSGGAYGHLAVVTFPVTPNSFRVAEALGDNTNLGLVQERDTAILSVKDKPEYGFLRYEP